ncbi:RNI-like protein [Sistotremastrum suecicum HHB10207 ss-3]|uniref:RNI-like protein n=1 Tax=Sistotremastrum suecicum HHB10207 ss-3 TaxID=1314776 RepID=A0A165ZGW1_9AGAM|nr:RNI-like protein [Sistotremastrum suecicum HHB10207 ss-3]
MKKKVTAASPTQSATGSSVSDDEEDLDDTRNGLNLSILSSTSIFHPRSPGRWSHQERLPPEILIHILRQLHNPRDLFSSLLVSHAWCECAVELLWHRPNFAKVTNLFKMVQIISKEDQTFTYARFIRRLNFAMLGSELSDPLFTRLSACQRLERLTLVNCVALSDEALCRVLPYCPELVALDLTGVSETTDISIVALARSAHKLQGINLGGCKKVTDVGVSALAKNCPLLRRIKLSGIDAITDQSVSLLVKSCPLLLEIDLNNCPLITDLATRDLWEHSVHMRELRLSHCIELTENAFPAPPNALEASIAEAFPPSIPIPARNPNQSLTILPPLRPSRQFEHLRMLDLTACANVTDNAIEGIVTSAPKIRNLVLAKCTALTDAAVESICKLGKHLHWLHMGHAIAITDRAVRTLAFHCSRLRYIDLACCSLLTDLSVFELAHLQKLRRVGLVRVSNLTDEGVVALATRANTLERIHLSYCENITVQAVYYLLSRLNKLTHLSLTGIPSFRREELQKFCRPPPREFNTAQRAAFCVYSGPGVNALRKYLETIMANMREEVHVAHENPDSSDEDENGDDGDDTGIIELGDDGDAEDGESDIPLYPGPGPGRRSRALRNGNVTMQRHGPGRRNGTRAVLPHTDRILIPGPSNVNSNSNSAASASGSGTSSASGSGSNLVDGANVDRRGAASPTMSVGSDGGATVISIGTVRGRSQHPQPQLRPPPPQQSRQQFINGNVLEGWTGAFNPPAQYTLDSSPNTRSTNANNHPPGPVALARQRMLELQFGSASVGASPASPSSVPPPAPPVPTGSNAITTDPPWAPDLALSAQILPPSLLAQFKQPTMPIEEPVYTRGRPGNASAAAAGAVYAQPSSSTSNANASHANANPSNVSPARSRRSLRTTLSDASALLFGRNTSGSTSGSGNNSPGGINGAAAAAANALQRSSPTPSTGSGSGPVNGTRNGRS